MEPIADQRLDDVAGEELAAKQEQRRDDILAELLNGKRWEELADYIYDFHPDWLNEVVLNDKRYIPMLVDMLRRKGPPWLVELAERIANKEAQ